MANGNINARTLHELYQQLGLSTDSLQKESGFTIHYLEDTFKNLPFRSEPFRPNYFSFLLSKVPLDITQSTTSGLK